jgi:hypothetical protein
MYEGRCTMYERNSLIINSLSAMKTALFEFYTEGAPFSFFTQFFSQRKQRTQSLKLYILCLFRVNHLRISP